MPADRTPSPTPRVRRGPRVATLIAVLAVLASLVASALAGCAPASGSATTHLTVFAAASLTDAVRAAADAYAASHPGVQITAAFDSSATLRVQIEQGAPVDLFLAADQANARALVDDGHADGAAVDFAANSLAIVVPAANPAAIESPADLARPAVRIVAAGDQVPISTYASRLVANLASLAGYPSDFAAAYRANVVSREDNVRAILAKVELGEGDAGIVYATDAAASTKVRQIGIPPASNVSAVYAGAVVRASSHLATAHAFLAWLAGPDGRAVLARYGFTAP